MLTTSASSGKRVRGSRICRIDVLLLAASCSSRSSSPAGRTAERGDLRCLLRRASLPAQAVTAGVSRQSHELEDLAMLQREAARLIDRGERLGAAGGLVGLSAWSPLGRILVRQPRSPPPAPRLRAAGRWRVDEPEVAALNYSRCNDPADRCASGALLLLRECCWTPGPRRTRRCGTGDVGARWETGGVSTPRADAAPQRLRRPGGPPQRRQDDADQRAGRREGRHRQQPPADHPARHPRGGAQAGRPDRPRRHPGPAQAEEPAGQAAQRRRPRHAVRRRRHRVLHPGRPAGRHR